MRHIIFVFILFPVAAFAQGYPNMPKMGMEQMQKAMTCMKIIDRPALEGLEEEGRKMKAEVGALCRSGKRDEAQENAMGHDKDMMNRPELKKMREWGKMAARMIPKMPIENIEEESKNRHICDDL